MLILFQIERILNEIKLVESGRFERYNHIMSKSRLNVVISELQSFWRAAYSLPKIGGTEQIIKTFLVIPKPASSTSDRETKEIRIFTEGVRDITGLGDVARAWLDLCIESKLLNTAGVHVWAGLTSDWKWSFNEAWNKTVSSTSNNLKL